MSQNQTNKKRTPSTSTYFTASPDAPRQTMLSDQSSFTFSSQKELTFHVWTTQNTDYHNHNNYFEIFLVTEGKVLHNFKGRETVMQKGDAFIMLPHQYHNHLQYKNYSSEHINLTCSIPFASFLFKGFFNSDIYDFPQEVVRFKQPELDVITKMQELILKSASNELFTSYIQSLLVLLIRIYCQHIMEKNQSENDPKPKWLRKFVVYLQSMDMSKPIQMSELYLVSGVSQSKLSREFKKHMGQTLVSYVTDLRLNYACNLLKTTSFSVNRISELCGFENYITFWRVFKSKNAMTPTDYRDAYFN